MKSNLEGLVCYKNKGLSRDFFFLQKKLNLDGIKLYKFETKSKDIFLKSLVYDYDFWYIRGNNFKLLEKHLTQLNYTIIGFFCYNGIYSLKYFNYLNNFFLIYKILIIYLYKTLYLFKEYYSRYHSISKNKIDIKNKIK